MTTQHGVRLDANEAARQTVPKGAAISWPFPVDRRLDQLVELANEAGANTRRNELAAAVMAAAPTEAEQLLDLVISWRKLKVHQVVLDVDSAAQIIEIPRYRPGRRSAASD